MDGVSIDQLNAGLIRELAPGLVELDRIIFRKLFDGYADRAWTEDDFGQEAPHRHELSCVARSSGDEGTQVVGFWVASRRNLTTVHIERVAVHPSWQGKGIGKALFAAARDLAAAAGARQMMHYVNAVNRTAIAFCEIVGFSQLTGDRLKSLVGDQPGTTIQNNFVFIDDVHHHAMLVTL